MEQSVVGTILTKTINLTIEGPFALETVLRVPVTVETMIDELVAPFSDTWQSRKKSLKNPKGISN